jgi:hypothetical protein
MRPRKKSVENVIKFLFIIFLLFLQMFTHMYKSIIGDIRRKNAFLGRLCKNYIHFSEEQLSFIFSLGFIVILMIIQKPKRFSNYITNTYGRFMESKVYKDKMKKIKIDSKIKISSSCCLNKIQFFRIFVKFKKFLLPISPFNSNNTFNTIAIYILYTYDILNIFTYVYSSFLVLPIFQLIRNKSGILTDFIFQIVHVFFIGLKFYPLLAVQDIKETVFTNFMAFIYTFILLLLKLINKGLCSRTEVFIQLVLDNIYRIKNSSRIDTDNLNLTQLIINRGESEELVYDFLIKNKIPQLFNDTFKENQIVTPLSTTKYSTRTLMHKISGYRKNVSNQHQNIGGVFDDIYNDENKDIYNLIRGLCENFPLYLSLAYLLGSYFISFIYCVEKKFQDNKLNSQDSMSFKILRKEFQNNKLKKIRRRNSKCDLCCDKYSINDFSMDNQNYNFIRNRIGKKRILSSIEIRYSRQFIYTYTVSFMVVYFFTVFLFRVTNIFGNLLMRIAIFIIRQIFKNDFEATYLRDLNVIQEFRIAHVITSIISTVQMIQSIFAFQNRVKNLNVTKEESYFLLAARKRSKVVRESLHFSGYLVAHLVYGYMIIVFLVFLIILIIRIIYYTPFIIYDLIQFILPIVLMILLKSVFLRSVIYGLFECKRCDSQQGLIVYSTLSYFNFFFDCFLGFMSCLNRIWKTTLISIFYVIRLDVSIFSEDNDLILGFLDSGHVAFKNFSFIEYSLNNPVINGFCEILIEIMLQSFILEDNLKHPICDCEIKKTVKIISKVEKYSWCTRCSRRKKSNLEETELQLIKDEERLKYKSYNRLRLYLYLFYTLRRFSELRKDLSKKDNNNRHSLDSFRRAEFTNISIQNEDLLKLLVKKDGDKKFKINNQYVCVCINDYSQNGEEIVMISKLLEFSPLPGGIHKLDDNRQLRFINTQCIDYFLYAIWISLQNTVVNRLIKTHINQTYKVFDEIVNKINENKWSAAKYLWLLHVRKVEENDQRNLIDCMGNLDDFFLLKMLTLQMYKQEKSCSFCKIIDQNISYQKTLNLKMSDKNLVKFNFEEISEKCNNKDCNGVMTNQINLIYSPIWIFIEFSFECTYNIVPLNIEIDSIHFRLNCCITRKNENLTAVYYINKKFYVFDIFQPHSLIRLNHSYEPIVVCAIYQINI